MATFEEAGAQVFWPSSVVALMASFCAPMLNLGP